MFNDIECPTPAYERIVSSGIDKRIESRKEDFKDITLYDTYTFEGAGLNLLRWAQTILLEGIGKKISVIKEVAKDVVEFDYAINARIEASQKDCKSNRFHDVGEFLLEHPAFLSGVFLGEDLARFEEYGFPTLRSLEESVTSFCIGEGERISSFDNRTYFWRSRNNKNLISQNIHGDLYAGQIDVSGREWIRRTLFGKEACFDTFKQNPYRGGIHAHQDWSLFLVSLLRYAEAIGKSEMDEIVHWRDVLEETGSFGNNTAEAEFGSGISSMIFLMDPKILRKGGKRLNNYPLNFSSGPSAKRTQIPYVEDGKLKYLVEDSNGNIDNLTERLGWGEGTVFENKNFSVRLEYSEEDLPHALKAAYMYFARDRSLLPEIMNHFNSEIR